MVNGYYSYVPIVNCSSAARTFETNDLVWLPGVLHQQISPGHKSTTSPSAIGGVGQLRIADPSGTPAWTPTTHSYVAAFLYAFRDRAKNALPV
jgi:hypothetical protein